MIDKYIFIQQRIGIKGAFDCYKFRTMKRDTEHLEPANSHIYKDLTDARILPARRWMRRTGFDELPQLINVYKGDMRFFGARPLSMLSWERLSEAQRRIRIASKPGCFGPYAMLWNNKNPDNLLKANEAFVRLERRIVTNGGWFKIIKFRNWVLYRTIIAICEGKVK